MHRPSPAQPAPRARQDPVRTPEAALQIVDLARSSPPREEIIAFFLDASWRGLGLILDLTDVRAPEDVLAVTEHLGRAVDEDPSDRLGDAAWMVLASIRLVDHDVLDDVDLWQRVSDLADAYGVPVVEWFVLGPSGTFCPRDILGEPHRWPS